VVEDEWKDKVQIDKCERNPGQVRENPGLSDAEGRRTGKTKLVDGGVVDMYRVLGVVVG
jgi:hypothetical protein